MIFQDVRFAARLFAKDPLFAAVAILTLALGIGATSTIFSLVDTIIFRPFPHLEEPQRIVWLFEHAGELDDDRDVVSAANFADWRAQSKTLSHLSAINNGGRNLTGAGEPESLRGYAVSANYFDMLGARPALGRTFEPAEDTEGKDDVVVITDGFWRRRFGADPRIIGQSIVLDGERATIIGVMPRSFAFPKSADIYVPLPITAEMLSDRAKPGFAAIGRIAPGSTQEEATAELEMISRRLGEQYPVTNKGVTVSPVSVMDLFVGPRVPPMIALVVASIFVLLIACANVSNLLLARGAARMKEIAVRAALGATPGRLTRQLLTESLVLAIGGGAGAVLVAMWGVDLFASLIPDQMALAMPRLKEVAVDLRVFAFTTLMTCAATAIFGWLPAIRASRVDLTQAFKEGGGGATTGSGHRRLRESLVVAQVCLALMLVIGAGWAVQSFLDAQNIRLGFDPQNTITQEMYYAEKDTPESTRLRLEEALGAARSMPGTIEAALASEIPLSRGFEAARFEIEGRAAQKEGEESFAKLYAVSDKYFEVVGVRRVSGRAFDDSRDREDGPRVAIVTQQFVRTFMNGEEPLGKRFSMEGESWEIAGVAEDLHELHASSGAIYVPWRQAVRPSSLLVKTGGAPEASIELLRDKIRALDRDRPVGEAKTMATVVEDAFAGRRILKDIFLALSLLALILAAIGIYGVVSYSVSQRTAELGIRAALGAAPRQVMSLVLRQGMRLTGVGVAVGLILSVVITTVIARATEASAGASPAVFGGGVLALIAVALAACYGPARRAMRIPPMMALKRE